MLILWAKSVAEFSRGSLPDVSVKRFPLTVIAVDFLAGCAAGQQSAQNLRLVLSPSSRQNRPSAGIPIENSVIRRPQRSRPSYVRKAGDSVLRLRVYGA